MCFECAVSAGGELIMCSAAVAAAVAAAAADAAATVVESEPAHFRPTRRAESGAHFGAPATPQLAAGKRASDERLYAPRPALR